MVKEDCRLIFDALPGSYLIVKPDPPDFTIVDFNRARAAATMSGTDVIGKPLFDAFPDNLENPAATGVKNLYQSLMTVMETKQAHTMALQRYDLYNPRSALFEERYWIPRNIPVFGSNGDIRYIIHSAEDVTENILLERKEKQSRQEVSRLHHEQTMILESIADGFLSVDRNWIVQYWNKQAERIFQISREQLLGKYLWDHVKEQKDNKLFDCFSEAMEKMKPSSFEKFYTPQNIWLQVNAYPSDYGLTAFLLDITERKTAQQELENSERRFRALVENSSDGITVIAADGTVLDVSHSARKILGHGPEDLVRKVREDLIHPDDLAKVQAAFQNVIQTPSAVQTIEYRFKMPTGCYKWLEGSFHNLLHEPTINAVVLNYRDITERKKQDEKLLASEEKYRYLFDNNPATIIIWTLDDLKIREVNELAVQLLGYPRDEFLRMTVLDIRPVEEHERFLSQVVELRKLEGIRTGGTWIFQKHRGELVHMSVSFHRIAYAGRDAVLALGTDITERVRLEKRLEAERRRKQKEITEAVLTAQENERAELGKELHDNINQILTTTRLYIEYVLSKKGEQQELLTQSHTQISNAIREIRQLSRALLPPSLGETTLQLSLEDLIRNVNALNSIDFSVDYAIDDEQKLGMDLQLAIFRIVQEQLNNIIRHSKADRVQLRLWEEDDQILLLLKDNGVGFDPKRRSDGLGLRNIISRANLYRGQVSIDSQPGAGTELKVSFELK